MEHEEEIYRKIILYYDIADKIKEEIIKLDDIDDSIRFNTLMPITEKIRNTADILLEKYVELLKNTENNYIKDDIVKILDNLLEQIYIYKNKVYDIYKDK